MILVVNLGLKSIRAILFDFNGNRISLSREKISTFLDNNTVEQDASEWREKFYKVINKAVKKIEGKYSIKYITVTCSASCLIPLDKDFKPTNNVIMVSDKRAQKEANTIKELKNIIINYNINESEINAYSQISRILWLKNNKIKEFNKTKFFLSPNDFLIGLLLDGEYITDPLNAKKMLYNEKSKSYPKKLYEKLGINIDTLPRCNEIGTNLGKISTQIAQKLSIGNQPEVILTTYDAITSIVGGGGIYQGNLSDQSGTVSSIRMFNKNEYFDKENRIF